MVPMISNDPLRSAGTLKFQLLDGSCESTSVMWLRFNIQFNLRYMLGYLVILTGRSCVKVLLVISI